MAFGTQKSTGLGLIIALVAAASAIPAEDRAPKSAQRFERTTGEKGAAEICNDIGSAALEARIAWQTQKIQELDARLRKRIEEFTAVQATTKEWIGKRAALESAASAEVVAIYAKMDFEAAAGQLAASDDALAASILSKLEPKVASQIFAEMDPVRASQIAAVVSGIPPKGPVAQ